MKRAAMVPIADALKLLRMRRGLTQTAASKVDGAPDFRTLSHWETRRKAPSLPLLASYLGSLDFDFADLQEALNQIQGEVPKDKKEVRQLGDDVDSLVSEVASITRQLKVLTERVSGPPGGRTGKTCRSQQETDRIDFASSY